MKQFLTLLLLLAVMTTPVNAAGEPTPWVWARYTAAHEITADWRNVPPGACIIAVEAGQADRVLACGQATGTATFAQPRSTTVQVAAFEGGRGLAGSTVLPVAVDIAWAGPYAVTITWSGLPPGACVRRNGTILSDTCRPRGTLTLPTIGLDDAYAFEGGDVVDVWVSGEVLASDVLPMRVVILPLVVRE